MLHSECSAGSPNKMSKRRNPRLGDFAFLGSSVYTIRAVVVRGDRRPHSNYFDILEFVLVGHLSPEHLCKKESLLEN